MGKRIVIIGAGIGGLTTAYFLNKQGAQVTVIDRGKLNDSASLGNAGILSMFEKSPMSYPGVFLDTARAVHKNRSPIVINSIFDLQLLKWGVEFAKASSKTRYYQTLSLLEQLGEEVFEFYDTLSKKDKIDFEYQRKGFALVYTDEKNYLKKINSIPPDSTHYKVLTKEQIASYFPFLIVDNIAGAVVLKRNGHINPKKVVQGLHKLLKKRGVEFRLEEEITKIEKNCSRVSKVCTTTEEFDADEFVIATGANLSLAKQINSKLLIVPGRGYSLTFSMKPDLKPAIPMLFSDLYTAVSPWKNNVRITGKIEFGTTTSTSEERINSLVRLLKNYTKEFTIEKGKIWTGDRPLTGNGKPYLGRDEKYQNVIYVMGLGHTGLSIGPICGRIASEIIMKNLKNTEHEDLLSLSNFYQM